MIRLESLLLKNFRSFKEEAEIRFPDHGIVGISGINQDSGGSSGAGKSTVVLGIAYALGFCPLDGTKLKTWGSDKPMRVQLRVKLNDGKALTITRGVKFELVLDGAAIPGSASHKEAKLRELLGIDPRMLSVLTYRRQKKPSLFLSMTDSEKKEFLSDLLGLTKFEEEADRAVKEANKKQEELAGIEIALNTAKASVPLEPPKYVPADVSAVEREIIALKSNLEATRHLLTVAEFELESSKNREAAEKEEISKVFQPKIEKAKSELRNVVAPPDESKMLRERLAIIEANIRSVRQDHLAKTNQLNEMSQQRTIADLEASRLLEYLRRKEQLEKEIQISNSQKCPTCGQNWDNHESNEHRANQLAERKKIIEAIDRSQLACLNVLKLEAAIKELMAELNRQLQMDPVPQLLIDGEAQLKNAIAGSEAKRQANFRADLEEKQKALQKEENAALSEFDALKRTNHLKIGNQVNEIQRLRMIIGVNLSELTAKTKFIQDVLIQDRQNQIANQLALDFYTKSKKAVAYLEAKLQALDYEVATLKDFTRMVGRDGFLGAIFDEVLGEISTEVNSRLINLPNISSVTLQFKSMHQTEAGLTKKEIRPVLLYDGNEIPIESISGGQETSIELAVDRSVATVIGRRTGAAPAWIILDEAFNGMDTITKENCTDILREIAKDCLVLVIDHSAEFRELFDQFIRIDFQDGCSRVV